MAKLKAKHAKKGKSGSLLGRIIHDIPNSLANAPKPSDKPTKKLDEEKIEVPVIPTDPNPGTTVLGMEIFDEAQDSQAPVKETTADDKKFANKKSSTSKTKKDSTAKKTSTKKPEVKKKTATKKTTKNVDKKPKTAVKKTTNTKTKAPRYASLILIRKSDGEVIKVSKKDFVIGKSKYSDYQITKNNTVSRSHIIAHKLSDGSLTVEDNDSKNGTFLDGERLEAHKEIKLKIGQTLRLSDEVFEVSKV